MIDEKRSATTARRVARWITAVLLVGIVIGGGIAVGRSPYMRQVTYRLQSHTGTPVTIATAAPTSVDVTTAQEAPSAVGNAQPADVSLRLAVAGDVGTGGSEEYATADAMDRLEGDVEYRALLLLGDNVYEDGDPEKVEQRVFEPFAGVLDGDTELLAVLGNHDVDSGFGEAQATALGMPGAWYSTRYDDVLVIGLDSNRPDDPDQLEWLTRTLAESTESWKIVMMHHPPYSGGSHGSDMRLRAAFAPLFATYGVQLVLAGHDHDYQRSEQIDGVTYVVSGGAARLRPTRRADFSVAAWSILHFTDITVWDDHLDLRAIDQQLEIFDMVTLTP